MSNYKKYGLTLKQYEEMKIKSNNTCYICGKPPKKRSLCVDHNHKTDAVRGLLCFYCNKRLIGSTGDRKNAVELFENALNYIKANEDWRKR